MSFDYFNTASLSSLSSWSSGQPGHTRQTGQTSQKEQTGQTDLTFKLDFPGHLDRAAFAILAMVFWWLPLASR